MNNFLIMRGTHDMPFLLFDVFLITVLFVTSRSCHLFLHAVFFLISQPATLCPFFILSYLYALQFNFFFFFSIPHVFPFIRYLSANSLVPVISEFLLPHFLKYFTVVCYYERIWLLARKGTRIPLVTEEVACQLI